MIPSHPAATTPLIPPPFSSYADFMLFSFSFAVLTAADITFDTVSLTPLNTFDAACPIGVFKTASFISFTLFDTASFALLNAPVMTSLILLKTSLIFAQNSASFSLTLSQFLYKATPAAISPAISVTIRMIGHKFMTVLSAPCATVIAPVVVVAAVVAAACAVVAAVPAASAAVPAAVAAVFAVIFAMIEETPETNCCPVLIVEEMPCANFPIPIAAGPTAAVNIPILSMVCCCPSSSEPNHSHNVCTFSVNCSTNGAADDMIVCPNCSTVFFSSFIAIFMSYEVVCIFSNAVSVAPVDCLISFSVPLNESALSPNRISPAFAASAEENMSLMVRFSSFAAPSMICSTSARLEPLAMSSLNDFPVFSRRITSVVLPVFPNSLSIEFM